MKMLLYEGSDRSVAHLLSFDDEQRQSPVVRGTLAVLCPTFSDAGDGRGSVAVFTTFHTSYQIVILPFSSTPTVSISKSSFVKFGHRLWSIRFRLIEEAVWIDLFTATQSWCTAACPAMVVHGTSSPLTGYVDPQWTHPCTHIVVCEPFAPAVDRYTQNNFIFIIYQLLLFFASHRCMPFEQAVSQMTSPILCNSYATPLHCAQHMTFKALHA